MKIHELIAELSKFDPELEVMVHGYEGGAQTIAPESLYQRHVQAAHEGEWFYGDHRFVKDDGFPVLIISRIDGERGGKPEIC